MAKVSVDDKLGRDKFYADLDHAHITIDEDYHNEREIHKLVLACPAGLYKCEDGVLTYNYEGCLECGTCRIIALGKAVKTWDYPEGGFGVEYRQG
jgi:ferredoxin like protein